MTGFSKQVREIMQARSSGFCEICGVAAPDDAHHRRPRGAGGSKADDTNWPSNGLLACRRCHELVESRRELALDRGWLVRQGQSPSSVPVLFQGNWALLTDDGAVFRPPRGGGRCERCGFHVPSQQHRPGCQVAS